MSSWRFADREWFVNDNINLRSEGNLELVAAELQFPNIAFGVHRWFSGGAAPDCVAIATPEQWADELSRGRPGDNLMLLSLRRVADLAVIHAGELARQEPPTLAQEDLDRLRATLSDPGREFAVVHRFSPAPGELVCSYDVLWDPEEAEWEDQFDRWSGLSGELFFFDNEIVWQQHHSRVRASQPPEQWVAQHGLYLVDGYIPDDAGPRFVVPPSTGSCAPRRLLSGVPRHADNNRCRPRVPEE